MLQARLVIKGHVQRVGYRDWTVENALRLGLTGWVRNCKDEGKSVEALLVGDEASVGKMIEACRKGPGGKTRVDSIDVEPVDLDILPEGFRRRPDA